MVKSTQSPAKSIRACRPRGAKGRRDLADKIGKRATDKVAKFYWKTWPDYVRHRDSKQLYHAETGTSWALSCDLPGFIFIISSTQDPEPRRNETLEVEVIDPVSWTEVTDAAERKTAIDLFAKGTFEVDATDAIHDGYGSITHYGSWSPAAAPPSDLGGDTVLIAAS